MAEPQSSPSTTEDDYDWASKRETNRIFIPSFEIRGDEEKFPVFLVFVQSGGIRWKVYRRSDEFDRLYEQLAFEFDPLPRMTSKKSTGSVLSVKSLEGRRQK